MHEEGGPWLEEYLHLLQSPGHILFEITLNIVIDFVIIYLGYQLLIKKVIIPRLRKQIHAEIDQEHHIEHGEEDEWEPTTTYTSTPVHTAADQTSLSTSGRSRWDGHSDSGPTTPTRSTE